MKTCLINVIGWLGDSLFASSIAERLLSENKFDKIDYLIGFPQTKYFLENNPYINNIFVEKNPTPYPNHSSYYGKYDEIFTLPVNDLKYLPTVKFQKHCGVENTKKEFYLYHSFEKQNFTKPLIGVCSTWKDKNENFRNSVEILEKLQQLLPQYEFILLGNNISQFQGANDVDGYIEMAKTMYNCQIVIGTEGGMTNLASGLRTKTICTTDFTNSLFGKNGRLYQYKDWYDRIAPSAFFPNDGHINLAPTIDTNEKIIQTIYNILN
jgi:ADP-heptose:LPS heptosyltransferase